MICVPVYDEIDATGWDVIVASSGGDQDGSGGNRYLLEFIVLVSSKVERETRGNSQCFH